MTTTEVLKLQLGNTRREVQQLQVDNQKFQAEVRLGEEQLAEIEELRQRLLDSEEKVIGAEQEAEQWKEETEKLSTALAGVKEEYKKTVKLLNDELMEKASLIEQLKTAGSELQLELDRLRAQNLLLLQTRTGDESHSTMKMHATETAHVNEASLRSIAVSGNSGGVLDNSTPKAIPGGLGYQESTACLSWSTRNPVNQR